MPEALKSWRKYWSNLDEYPFSPTVPNDISCKATRKMAFVVRRQTGGGWVPPATTPTSACEADVVVTPERACYIKFYGEAPYTTLQANSTKLEGTKAQP